MTKSKKGESDADENEAEDVASVETESATPTASKAGKGQKKVKFPCGKCDQEATGNALCCLSCEQWFHFACVEGMNKDYFDNLKKMSDMSLAAFLCKTCRKVFGVVTKEMKSLKAEVKGLKDQLMVLELEKETLAQKVENLELKAERVKSQVEGFEKEVNVTVEKAREEMKMDVRSEMEQKSERGSNIVIFGLAETKETDTKKWKELEQKKVEELMTKIEVEGEVQVMHRAGKPRAEGENPRPTIVKIANDEMREKVFKNASKLSKIVGMEKVFLNYDLTPQQREDDKKKETELKEEAARRTEEEEKNGTGKKYIVVGSRGRRRVVLERNRV